MLCQYRMLKFCNTNKIFGKEIINTLYNKEVLKNGDVS